MNARRLLLTGLCVLVLHDSTAAPSDPIFSRIRRAQVASSAIASIGYSRRLHALEIEFRNGAIYRYLDVPVDTYRELLAAGSKTRFYDENIRGRYRSLHVRRPAQ
ncbi:MAG: KTSC domain-containing protein [Chthoniobacterales bacterium]